jgi:hypothetical protein
MPEKFAPILELAERRRQRLGETVGLGLAERISLFRRLALLMRHV